MPAYPAPSLRASRSRSHEVLAQAVQICGREIAPGRYRIPLSQRALARELDMSISNLRRHLEQAGDQIVTLNPLCIELRQSPIPTAAAPGGQQSLAPHHPAPELRPISMAERIDSGVPADASTALAAELLRYAAELQQTAAQLIQRAAALLDPPTDDHARTARGLSGARGAGRAVSDSDSQSVVLPFRKDTDWLSDSPDPARCDPARTAPQPPREPRAPLADDELDQLLEPLVGWCRKTGMGTVDPAGRRRLALYSPEDLRAGVAHTLNQLRTQPGIVRRPFGLLITMLNNNDVPPLPTQRQAPTVEAPPPPANEPDPVLAALAQRCGADDVFWNAHVASRYPTVASRCPTGPTARSARILAAFESYPELVALAQHSHPAPAP